MRDLVSLSAQAQYCRYRNHGDECRNLSAGPKSGLLCDGPAPVPAMVMSFELCMTMVPDNVRLKSEGTKSTSGLTGQ
jgi:hypothetical protein